MQLSGSWPVTALCATLVPAAFAACAPATSLSTAPLPDPAPSAPAPPSSGGGPLEGRGSDAGLWTSVRAVDRAPLLSVPARALAPPAARAEVAVTLDARVLRVHADLGSRVEEGAPLVDVVMPALADAAAQLLAARVRLDALGDVAERMASLATEGLTTVTQRTDIEVQRAMATADLFRARATLTSAGLREGEASSLVESGGRLSLRSPIAGHVHELNAVPGAFVSPGAPPLVRVVAAAARRLEARVPLGALSLEEGEFQLREGGSRPARREGCLSAVEPSDDAVRCFFSLEGEPLPADAPGVLQLQAQAESSLIVVSSTALGLDESGPFVWRRSAAGPQERVSVTVKGRLGRDVLLASSLRPGDLVWGDAARLPGVAP